MPQSDRNNGLFHCPRQARDGEVHHGKQTSRGAGTVKHRYLREASHEPRQQAIALKARDVHSHFCCSVICTLLAISTHLTLLVSWKFWTNLLEKFFFNFHVVCSVCFSLKFVQSAISLMVFSKDKHVQSQAKVWRPWPTVKRLNDKMISKRSQVTLFLYILNQKKGYF